MTAKNTLPPHSTAPSKAVINAIKKLLRPLVRLLLSFQITLPFLVELLKEVYVDVAEKDFPLDNKKQTDTRISLLTGVHRKDTKRLRQKENTEASTSKTVSVGVELVTKWISDPHYLDAQGKPRQLALKAADAGDIQEGDSEPDFEHLVQSVCKQDMRARVILDEWLRLGIVELIDEQWVKLKQEGFIPAKGQDEKAFYLGMNIADHLEASTQNLLADKPPFLERCVYYDGLSQASIEKLEAEAKTRGMQVLQELNQQALKLREEQDNTPAENDPAHRMNFGLYFFSAQEEKSDDESS